jgi:hypothetical protein
MNVGKKTVYFISHAGCSALAMVGLVVTDKKIAVMTETVL